MAVFVVVACLFAVLGAGNAGDFCSSGSYCERCIDDIHHMSGTVDLKVDHFNTNIQSLKSALAMSIRRLKGSLNNNTIDLNIKDKKTRILNQLESHKTILVNELNKLRLVLNHKPKDYNLITIVNNIQAVEVNIRAMIKNVLSLVSKILILAKNPPSNHITITRINIQVLQISRTIVQIQSSFASFVKIDRAITFINSLKVSINSVSTSLVHIDQSIKQIVSIHNHFRSNINLIRINQVNIIKRIDVLINNIDVQFVDIYQSIQSHNTYIVSINSVVRMLQANIHSVSVVIANFKVIVTKLSVNIVNINKEVSVVYNAISSFSLTINRIVVVINNLKSKSSLTYHSFVGVQGNVKKLTNVIDVFISKEKSSILHIISFLDSIIKLQNTNILSIKSTIGMLKTKYAQLSATVTKNGASFASAANRVNVVTKTMSEAIEILKNLVDGCNCKSKSIQKCPNQCTSHVSVVCASNGHTYTNECYMNLAACKMDTYLKVLYNRVCEYKPTIVTTTAITPCTKICPFTLQAVCGSDGNTYSSQCDVDKHNCRTGANVKVVSQHACIKTTAEPTCRTACPRILQPVCGSDGFTYDNMCLLNRYNCIHKKYIYVVRFSACKVVTIPTVPTLPPRRCEYGCPAIYRPMCATDGVTYNSRCHLDEKACRIGDNDYFKHAGPCGVKPATTPKTCGICITLYKPVCGSDGKTHSNECFLKQHACITNKFIYKVRDGSCKTVTIKPKPCGLCVSSYKPVCGSDGVTYGNDCLLRRQVCLTNKHIYKISDGNCGEVVTSEPTPKTCRFCTSLYKPVCGSDGKTYSNECFLKRHACITKALIYKVTEGPCHVTVKPTPRSCGFGLCISLYKPVCGSDGVTYGSDCLLERQACLANTHIYKLSDGNCVPGGGGGGCVIVCVKTFSPVCGSDGQTYDNDCLRRNMNCVSNSAPSSVPGYCGMTCTGGFIKVAGISGCFYLVKPTRTTSSDDARRDCSNRGARLIAFASDEEYAAMQAYVSIHTRTTRKRNYWTSGREVAGADSWVWYPEGYRVTLKRSWHTNRPKRSNSCASMYGTVRFAMVDVKCDEMKLHDEYGWICRK